MTSTRLPRGVAAVRAAAIPLEGTDADLDALLDLVGDAHFVLLGEASHGTHEFYATRVAITRRLVAERGFDAVAVEGDWPDSDRVNRYVRHRSSDADASEALAGFRRFPQWMWRNEDVVQLVDWLRTHNGAETQAPVGFYGIDLYSLHSSIDEVLRYLERVDPAAAKRARYRYRCFEHFGEDPQAYGYAASFDLSRSCEDEVVEQLVELQRRAPELASKPAADALDEFFSASRTRGWWRTPRSTTAPCSAAACRAGTCATPTWPTRSTRSPSTCGGRGARGRSWCGRTTPTWATRAPPRWARGRGQRRPARAPAPRRRRAAHRLLHAHGTVTAADDWGDPARRMRVGRRCPGSVERLMHDVGIERFFLPLRGSEAATAAAEVMREPMLERAIGVIYRPDTERQSHYFHARVGEQFDAVFHFDETSAVVPLERRGTWSPADGAEPPETFPSGL
jgi:erythromycin esterase-like protein